MRKSVALMVLCCGVLLTAACVSMSRADREFYRRIEMQGADVMAGNIKHPAAAGFLNILPGVGNFYLASGTEHSGQWMIGTLNLLVWPVSILWGVPEAAIDAQTINKMETVYYYRHGPGKEELAALQEEQEE